MQAPTATDLVNDAVVQQALDEAWADSLASDPAQRHEEGGWIYVDAASGRIEVRRAPRGVQAMIDLNHPPILFGCILVGKFHTHPNPTAEGWVGGPSNVDLATDIVHGVPDLIRADDGLYVSGHDSRRGGLTGFPGYPP